MFIHICAPVVCCPPVVFDMINSCSYTRAPTVGETSKTFYFAEVFIDMAVRVWQKKTSSTPAHLVVARVSRSSDGEMLAVYPTMTGNTHTITNKKYLSCESARLESPTSY